MRIIVHDRFFEPHQIVRLEALAPAHRGIELHQAIGIDHQLGIISDGFAHRLHARFVLGGIILAMLAAGTGWVHGAPDVRAADLDLQPLLALGGPVLRRFRHLLATVSSQAEGDVRRH